jgi:Zn-dependent protease
MNSLIKNISNISQSPEQDNGFHVSPVFMFIALTMVIAGYLSYKNAAGARFWIFLFVTSGWVISLSLHEFGHALTAFHSGDRSVADKGYLNLNPLKYTNVFMSILLPVIFLMMGGIGFPGGAVYINTKAIKNKRRQSLVSAAGPLATAGFALVLLLPFFFGFDKAAGMDQNAFWSGWALLTFLQITALLFNLLPVPGLDGFGIIEPFLPEEVMVKLRKIGGLFILAIFFLLFSDSPVSRGFWMLIRRTAEIFDLNMLLVSNGFRLFQFWHF